MQRPVKVYLCVSGCVAVQLVLLSDESYCIQRGLVGLAVVRWSGRNMHAVVFLLFVLQTKGMCPIMHPSMFRWNPPSLVE